MGSHTSLSPPSRRQRAGLAAAVTLVALAATLAPVHALEGAGRSAPPFVGADKLAHFLGFGAVAACYALCLDVRDRSPRVVLGVALLAATLLGGGVEVVQPLVGRDMSAWDLLADAAGAALAVAAYRAGHRYVRFAE